VNALGDSGGQPRKAISSANEKFSDPVFDPAGKHTCVFAGAGCSKALFDIPIQAELIDDFISWDMQDEREQHLSQSLRRLLCAIKDIELVVSHYHNLAYPNGKRDPSFIRELLFLRVALAQYLDDRMRRSQAQPKVTHARLLAKFMADRGLEASNLVVVTTNYDLVLETLLENIFDTDSYWYPGVSSRPRVQRIPVLKLHGSINWMENRGLASDRSFTRGSQKILIEAPSEMTLTRSPWDDWGHFFENNGTKYTPIIVPFLFQKNAWLKDDNERWKKIFDEVWKEAEELMSNATRLLFWGYGLPPADYHMFSFLYQILHDSTAECKVVDKTRDTNLIKIGELLVKNIGIFRNGLVSYLGAR
jgi:hypothetical protein